MPQDPCGSGAPRPPRRGDALLLPGVRQEPEPLCISHCRREREIADRPDVGPPERHQQVDVGGPSTDTEQGDEAAASPVVVGRRDRLGIEPSVQRGRRELDDVAGLLTGQPGGPGAVLAKVRDGPGSIAAGGGAQTGKGSRSGPEARPAARG